MKRLNVWDDVVQQLKGMKVGDTITISRDCRFSGKRNFNERDHLNRNYPINQKYLVCENISDYSFEPVHRFGQPVYIGYTADVLDYAKRKMFHNGHAFPAHKMPKDLGRFVLKLLTHGDICIYSTSWFQAFCVFELIEIREGLDACST